MASTILERRVLRRIPMLRDLSSRELEDVQRRMVFRSYQAGEVIWRTRGPLRCSGYVRSGEIELEYRVDGSPIRTTRHIVMSIKDDIPAAPRVATGVVMAGGIVGWIPNERAISLLFWIALYNRSIQANGRDRQTGSRRRQRRGRRAGRRRRC